MGGVTGVRVTVDRIEGDRAILIVRDGGGTLFEMPLALLPPVTEGDILDITITRNVQETQEARERTKGLIEKLKQKRPH